MVIAGQLWILLVRKRFGIIVMVFGLLFYAIHWRQERAASAPGQIAFQPGAPGESALNPLTLEETLNWFYERHNRLPGSWAEVEATGIIKDMPAPSPGMRYELDFKSVRLIEVPRGGVEAGSSAVP